MQNQFCDRVETLMVKEHLLSQGRKGRSISENNTWKAAGNVIQNQVHL